jgi:hypothetical protein
MNNLKVFGTVLIPGDLGIDEARKPWSLPSPGAADRIPRPERCDPRV